MTNKQSSEKSRRWWILAATSSCTAMTFLDQTILPVTLPTIQKELLVSPLGLQWLVNAYLLALTALVLAGGRVGDIFGHRKIFCIGLFLFALSSAMCGVSLSEGWFIFSRAFQGVGAALLIPATTAILASAFPPNQRGKAIGISTAIGSIFLMLGPFIGGLLTEYLSWRYVFWINLPIAAIGLILTLFNIPPSEKGEETFDFFGTTTFAIGISAFVIGLMQTSEWGWDSLLTLSLLIIGVVLIACLCIFDRKVSHPFIDFSIFKIRLFTGSICCISLIQFVIMITVFWAIYFQDVLDYSPLGAGVLSVIGSIPVMIVSPLSGYLFDRFGARLPTTLGFGIVVISLLWLVWTFQFNNPILLIIGLILFGFGVPLIFTPCFTTVISCVPSRKRGAASGAAVTIRQLAGTLGMAVLGTLFLHWNNRNITHLFAQNPTTLDLAPKKFEGILSQSPAALHAISSLPLDTASLIRQLFKHAFEMSFTHICLFTAFIAFLGFICAAISFTKQPEGNHD